MYAIRSYYGAYRVPFAIRWPGHIPAGVTLNDISGHNDMVPTLMAAAGGLAGSGAPGEPPHIILFPEIPFDEAAFLKRVVV